MQLAELYEVQKKIDLPFEIYRTQFRPLSTFRERNIHKGSHVEKVRQVLYLHAQVVAQYLAHREKDKTKNCLYRKAIFRMPLL